MAGTPVQELYDYLRVTATAVLASGSSNFGGFICTTAGNFTLQDASGNDIISAIAVTPGQFVCGGIACPFGMKVVLTAGAIGTVYLSR
jgi:hypothetical protein